MFDFLKYYEISWTKAAVKELSNLPKSDQKKIIKSVDLIASDPDSLNLKKLVGFRDLFRLRVGNYRIILHADKSKKLTVISYLGHRKDVYTILKRISFHH